MISDALSDAASAIEEYLKEFPETYEGLEIEIQVVLKSMELLRVYLDMPPDIADEYGAPLLRALRSIDVAPLNAVLKALHDKFQRGRQQSESTN